MNAKMDAALLRLSCSALGGTPCDELLRTVLDTIRRTIACESAVFSAVKPDGALEPGLHITPAAAANVPSSLSIAVRSGSKTYGALTVRSSSGFALRERTFVRKLADILAIAMRAEQRERAADVLFRRSRFVFENNPNPMLILDAATLRYVDVNQTAIDAYGYTREQFLTMGPQDLRAPGHVQHLEDALARFERDTANVLDTVHVRADGSRLDAHLTVVTVDRDGKRVYIVTVQDMTERNEALARALQSETQLAHDALYDRLTGLPNRAMLNERLTAAIARARAKNRMAAVLFIDVDDFKTVNDTLGHSAGDILLKEIAGRLRSNTRQLDCVARMGGDEFVAVLDNIGEAEHVAQIARHLGRVAAEPVRVDDREIAATISAGIALFPRDGEDAETLIRNADAAMYQAKRDGRATSRFFTAEMHFASEQRLRLEARLRKAFADDQFQLAYQPIFELNGGLRGAEALIRWPQADGTVLQPSTFIPYAEESGLIVPIGAWVLFTACFQNAAWTRNGCAHRVSVNVSAKQLADPHFLRTVEQALRDSGLPPAQLELELTETVMGTNIERNAAVIRELRGLGISIAVDDFGTGYNSLATLRSYTVDTLKLDRCFVTDIAHNPVDRAIASAVITAAHRLQAKVVAEGVETPGQLSALAALRCDAAQGFLFARPLPADDFSALLGEHTRPRVRTAPVTRLLPAAV